MIRFNFNQEQIENLKKWSLWLHSTDKQQGHYRLRPDEQQFCCLGLYAYNRNPSLWEYEENLNLWTWDWEDGKVTVELPPAICMELGLDQCFDGISQIDLDDEEDILEELTVPNDIEGVFILLNDVVKWTFEQIANEIDYILEHNTFSEFALTALLWKDESYKSNFEIPF